MANASNSTDEVILNDAENVLRNDFFADSLSIFFSALLHDFPETSSLVGCEFVFTKIFSLDYLWLDYGTRLYFFAFKILDLH